MFMKVLGRVIQSESVTKILQNEALLNQLLKVLSSSLEAKELLEDQYDQLLKSLCLAPISRVNELEEQFQRLKEEADALKGQLIQLATQSANEREVALLSQIEIKQLKAELLKAHTALREAQTQNTTSTAQEEHAQEEHAQEEHAQEEHAQEEHAQEEHAQEEYAQEEHAQEEHAQEEHTFSNKELPKWSMKLKKIQLIQIGEDLGIDVTNKMTKKQIISHLETITQ